MQNKRLIYSLIAVALLLVSLPLAVFLTQKKQENRSHASASTTLSLVPSSTANAPLQKNVGDTLSYDVMLDPGTNLPSYVRLELDYDSTKLSAATSSAFVSNIAAFPATMEGPIVTNNAVFIAVSIGPDPTRAIKVPTKVGTVTFTAIAPTTSTAVTFGPKAQVLSIAPSDPASANVLSTTTPGYVAIAAAPTATNTPSTPTVTPQPSATLTPSLSATPTAIPTSLPTATPIPSSVPTIGLTTTPTQIPGTTTLALAVSMHGIGNSGDNVNPSSSLSNKNPLHPVRSVQVFVYDTTNNLAATAEGTLTYDQTQGDFTGNVMLPSSLPTGQYQVKVQSPTHLRRLVDSIQTIMQGTNTIIPAQTLIAGDINSDNAINILDYNMLINCYSDLAPAVACSDTDKVLTDLNDDGIVNQIDYNFFLREITAQNGD